MNGDTLRRWTAALLAVAVAALAASPQGDPVPEYADRIHQASATQVQAEVDRIVGEQVSPRQAEVERLRAEIARLETELGAKNAQISQLQARVAELEAQLPPPPPATGLWWTQPRQDQYLPDRVVMAHYTPFPQSVIQSNEPMASDYSARQFLTVGGENGRHGAYGGLLRDAPWHGAPYPAADEREWRRAFAAEEIAAAVKYGIDGFFVDLVGASVNHSHWPFVRALLDAAPSYNGFRVVPMLDVNGTSAGSIRNLSHQQIASHVANEMLKVPSTWRLPDGRHVVGVYKGSTGPDNAWWLALAAAFASQGVRVAFVGGINTVSQASQFPSWYAVGDWGSGADPGLLAGPAAQAQATRDRGQRVLMPLLGENVRPRQGWYDEAVGLGALDASWDRINRETVAGAAPPIVQVVTWNDYAEGSAFGPSRAHGDAMLAYSAWRAAQWKTGLALPPQTDTVFISHRNQMLTATITGGQTQFMTHNMRGNHPGVTESVDEVLVRTILTKAAAVSVRVGAGPVVTYNAPAGESVRSIAARAGQVSVTLGTSPPLVSPVAIRATAVNQSRGWVHFWSGDTKKIFDPTPA